MNVYDFVMKAILAMMLGAFFGWLLTVVIAGCSFDVHHTLDPVDVRLDLGAECFGCEPYCGTHRYSCAPVPGNDVDCRQCFVACVGGRDLQCSHDGPHCLQTVDGEDIEMPVTCLRTEE